VENFVGDDLRLVKELNLTTSQVADVAPLAGLANLQTLSLNGTQVAEDQKQALKQALPKLTIID